MVHARRSASRHRWRMLLDDAGLLDALAGVLAELEPGAPPPPAAKARAAADAAADEARACVERLLGAAPALSRRASVGARAARAPAPPLAELLDGGALCRGSRVGLLIDLDGTIYSPAGLLPGAAALYERVVRAGVPHVFVSNTGAKTRAGVAAKLSRPPFALPGPPVDAEAHVWTAADAQVAWMVERVPAHARVLVVSGASTPFWMRMLHEAAPELVGTWCVRTTLSEAEAKQWAATAACHAHAEGGSARGGAVAGAVVGCVVVAFFLDGEIASSVDPSTGEAGYTDWSFDVVKKASYLLMHGATFVYTADDAFNPSADPEYPGLVWPLPGPGMFAAMMRKVMHPHGLRRLHCLGKGGDGGCEHMMGTAIKLLQRQGHSGERGHILMVGDRFDTDVRAGNQAGVRTCLVESGCHALPMQRHYPADVPDYALSGVAELARLLRAPPCAPRSPSRGGGGGGGTGVAPAPTAAPTPPPAAGAAAGAWRPPDGLGADPPSVGRARSEGPARAGVGGACPSALQRWMLAYGARASPGSARPGPLFPLLRAYYGAHDDVRTAGALSAAALRAALSELGLSEAEVHAACARLGGGALDFKAFFSCVQSALCAHVGVDALLDLPPAPLARAATADALAADGASPLLRAGGAERAGGGGAERAGARVLSDGDLVGLGERLRAVAREQRDADEPLFGRLAGARLPRASAGPATRRAPGEAAADEAGSDGFTSAPGSPERPRRAPARLS